MVRFPQVEQTTQLALHSLTSFVEYSQSTNTESSTWIFRVVLESTGGLPSLVKSCWIDEYLTNSFKRAHVTSMTLIYKPTPVPRPSYTAGPEHKGCELYYISSYTRPIYILHILLYTVEDYEGWWLSG